MTPKENYLTVLKGGVPEWLPIDTYTFYPPWFTPGVICIRPYIFNIGRMGGKDFLVWSLFRQKVPEDRECRTTAKSC